MKALLVAFSALRSLLASIVGSASGQELSAKILRGGVGSLLIKAGSTGISLLLAIVMARVLGVHEYGLYSFAFAIATFLAVPSQFGLPQLVVRETARGYATKQWRLVKGVWFWAGRIVFITSLIVALGTGAVSSWSRHLGAIFSEGYLVAAIVLLIPMVAIGKLRDSALRGLHHVLQGQLTDTIIRPALLLVLVCAFAFFRKNFLNASFVMWLHVVAAFLAFMFGAILLARAAPSGLRRCLEKEMHHRAWLLSAIPLAFTSGMQIINAQTDLLLLGALGAPSDVAVYRVVSQGATLLVFGINAINMVASPHMASLHAQGDKAGLQAIATLCARAGLAITLPIAVIFFVFGKQMLAGLFGDEYAVGAVALTIISFGQVLNSAYGSVGVLLNMTGHERDTAKGLALSACTNVALNLILIPRYGVNGAAVASCVTLLVWNVALNRSVRARLGINSIAIDIGRRA